LGKIKLARALSAVRYEQDGNDAEDRSGAYAGLNVRQKEIQPFQ
jgi:hypothetical protein